jgi:hypothetical protein
MKKTLEAKTPATTLPSFLDDGQGATEVATGVAESTPVAEDHVAAAPAVDATDPEDLLLAAPAASDANDTLEPEVLPPPRHDAPRRRSSDLLAPPAPGGGLSLALGGIAVATGLLSPMLPAPIAQGLGNAGLNGGSLLIAGVVLAATGYLRRHIGQLHRRLVNAELERQRDAEATRGQLQEFGSQAQTERPAAGEELQHLLMAMQRQDEKVNNLTKAIKMYGKPLMEIASQGTELAGNLGGVRTLVEGGNESTRQAVARIETQLRSAGGKQELAEVQAGLTKIAAKLEAVAGKGDDKALQPLQQQVGRLEISLAAVAQRLEDNEVRKSLLRLEEAAHKERDAVQELLRGDGLRQVATDLQNRFDKATKGLADGLAQMREGNLSGLEQAVRDIQREVAGVATTVAQINNSVKNGRGVAAAVPASV